MSDYDREPEGPRETERTTVVEAGGSGGDRGTLAIVAVVLLVGLAAILFFVLRGGGEKAADKIGVNVSLPQVDAPDINVNLPDVNVPSKIELPDVRVKTDGGGNKAGDSSGR